MKTPYRNADPQLRCAVCGALNRSVSGHAGHGRTLRDDRR
jgi:hypothetical protein